jgi:hypothetical protein
VTGTARVASKLTATTAGWDAQATLSYQWFANGTPVSGATNATFIVPASAAAKKISVRATAAQAGYDASSVTSASTPAAAKAKFVTKSVKISGTVRVGKTVKAKAGTWSPKPSLSYRWYANGKAIKGAKSSSLKVTSSLAGKKLSVKVTAKRSGYVTAVVSSARSTIKR